MTVLRWPSTSATHAEVWRLLDLSGLVQSQREALIAVNSRLVYINDVLVTSLKQRVKLKDTYTLEVRNTHRTKKVTFLLVNGGDRQSITGRSFPDKENRRG